MTNHRSRRQYRRLKVSRATASQRTVEAFSLDFNSILLLHFQVEGNASMHADFVVMKNTSKWLASSLTGLASDAKWMRVSYPDTVAERLPIS